MTTVNRWAIIAGLLLLLALGGLADHYRQKTERLSDTVTTLTAEQNSTARIIDNQQRTFAIFNAIAREADRDKKQIQQAAEDRDHSIAQALAGNACADEFVPDDAALQLLDYANRLRAGAVPAAAGGAD